MDLAERIAKLEYIDNRLQWSDADCGFILQSLPDLLTCIRALEADKAGEAERIAKAVAVGFFSGLQLAIRPL